MIEVTVLGSGSAGNAIAIRHQQQVVLVDAGFSAAEMNRRLDAAGIDPQDIAGMLVSHEHDDHVKGIRVFAKKNPKMSTFANALTAERLRFNDKAPEAMKIFANGSPFTLGPFRVEAFSVSHDAVDPVGFILQCGELRVGVATDFGHPGIMVPFKLKDCDIIVLESNHDPELLRQSSRPPQLQKRILGRRGHLSNQLACDLVPEIVGPRTRHLLMAHLSRDCNRPELVESMVASRLGEMQRSDVGLVITRQHEVCAPVAVG